MNVLYKGGFFMQQKIHDLVKQNHAAIVALRRHFHTHPELSTQEFKTQQRVMEELTALGLSPKKAATTGVIVDIHTGKPGKTVAIRADMDALALQDECGKPYQSQNLGVSHGCGHDGHTAMLIGVAKVLTALKDELSGTYRLLFQPSEEQLPGGALALINDGALKGVDCIIGAHLWQNIPVGKVGLSYDRLMAATDAFNITINGRGGHGSQPQETNDPLLTAAQIVVALNTIISRNLSALEPAVLSIGQFKSGEAFNVIPSNAIIKGNIRHFSANARETILRRIDEIVKGLTIAAGSEYNLEIIKGLPAVINNKEIAQVLVDSCNMVLGADNVIIMPPVLGSEDFSYYLHEIPGAFMFVGSGNEEKGISYPHHHGKFDIDEDSMAYGVESLALSAVNLAK